MKRQPSIRDDATNCTEAKYLQGRAYRQKKEQTWYFTFAKITDVRSLFGEKDGDEESVTSVTCTVRICEMKGKSEQV